MKARHQVSRNAIELIKRFEGYREAAAQLADGRWTIGYGHTLTARAGASVTLDDAEALLIYDLIAVAHAVNEHSYAPLNQNQFDALCSFAFNVGVEHFRRSAVLRRLNEGALIQAACAMEMWRKADFGGERIVIDALVRRRAAEKNLFLTPPDGWVPAPSPILPPRVDYDAAYSVPRQAPTAVVASLIGDRAEAHRDGTPPPVPAIPEEEIELTASERAAAAVSARLEALLPDEQRRPDPPPSPPADGAFDVPPIPEMAPPQAPPAAPVEPAPRAAQWPSPSLASDRQPDLLPPGPSELAPASPPAPIVETAPEPQADTVTLNSDGLFDTLGTATVAAEPASPRPAERLATQGFDPALHTEALPGSTKAGPYLAIAIISLMLFAGGVFGGLSAAADHSGGLFTAKAVSWLLCLLGAAGFVAAAYRLLRLIDGDETD